MPRMKRPSVSSVQVHRQLGQVGRVPERLAADHRAVARAGMAAGQPGQGREALEVGLVAPAHVVLDPDRVEAGSTDELDVPLVGREQLMRQLRCRAGRTPAGVSKSAGWMIQPKVSGAVTPAPPGALPSGRPSRAERAAVSATRCVRSASAYGTRIRFGLPWTASMKSRSSRTNGSPCGASGPAGRWPTSTISSNSDSSRAMPSLNRCRPMRCGQRRRQVEANRADGARAKLQRRDATRRRCRRRERGASRGGRRA